MMVEAVGGGRKRAREDAQAQVPWRDIKTAWPINELMKCVAGLTSRIGIYQVMKLVREQQPGKFKRSEQPTKRRTWLN